METFIVPKHLQNLTDDKGNTVLHHLATLKGTDQMRDFLGDYLPSMGVDVMAVNKDRKLAIDLTSPTDILRITLQRKMKEGNHIREQSKGRERKAKEEKKVEQKKESGDVRRKVQENKKADENQTKKPNTDDGKKSKPVKQKSKGPCDQCEIKLEEALAQQKEENYEKAYLSLVEVITSPHSTDVRHKSLRETSLQRLAALLSCNVTRDIPIILVSRLNPEGIKDLLDQLAQRKNWRLLEMLVTKTRMAGKAKALANFARSMSLLDAIVEPSADGLESTKIGLINLLQTNGAKFDKSTSAAALETCMKSSEWKVVLKLLTMGANPKGITLTPNDTPNHAALQVALVKEPGNFSIMEELRTIYEKDNASHPYLNVSCIDEDGNTLLHLAAMAKFSQHSLRAVEMLCGRHAPAGVPNKEGKLPIQCLPSLTDRRCQYLKNAMGRQGVSTRNLPGKVAGSKDQTKSGPPKEGPITGKRNIEAARSTAEQILKEIPDVSFDFLLEKGDSKGNADQNQQDSEEEEEDDDDSEDSSAETSVSEQENYDFDGGKSSDSKEDHSEEGSVELDVKSFDNLEWDVECTEEVWSLLRNRKERLAPKDSNSGENQKKTRKERIPDFLKEIIVKKIQQLASGDWRPQLQSPIKGVPDTLLLYRILLPQGASLIWELAVAFSPRRSETAERLLATGAGEDMSAVKGGRIYSELIRIWTVVLKNSDLRRAVRKIVSAHEKGKSCIIQKKLQGLSSSQFSGKEVITRFPELYVERSSDHSAVHMEVQNKFEKLLFPPASTHKNEFHILKFYSFSSSLVSAILNNSDTKIDFPFRVTDFEHAIINVDSSSPLLLLGRSGTGKTTCCLYRLWSVFLCYWEQAVKHGRPLLPRSDLPENLDFDNNPEETSAPKNESAVPAPDSHEFLDDVSDDDSSSQADADDDHGTWFEHLHQVFVTKNPVLCTEVEKNFLKLRHASAILLEHNSRATKSLPNTLQEVDDLCFPLFLTSRQLLLMLDASADGEPFFPRDEDLALKVDIPGWGTQEDIFNIAPLIHDFLVDSSEDEEDEGSVRVKNIQHNGARSKLKADPRRECTYEIFSEIWPKVTKKIQIDCHPSLVWTEIMSFIKGSFEALYTEKGYLEKNQYLELGRKRAPNFSGDRTQVYEVFLRYHSYKQQHFLFDEADLVFKVYTRLRTMTYCPWTFHEIYVDETQDFTQAELALLVSLCYDPNKMFLTGDTAQSIMRGISFRFSDLRALFHYAKETAKENEKYLAKIEVPKKIHQLRHNYRSHTGILSLASAVLDILTELFPDSFDPLQKDQGMFAGPKPVIIESCSPGDLALLLTGNRRKTSHIEFGAHQAILVVNEEAKTHLPEELSTGIILTIYESKGLEFDDILIYNFFKDSQTKKEWRVVTAILEKLASRGDQEGQGDDNLVEIDTDVLSQSSRPRPLQFDPNQHKILNSELKHLYTALTRARVNVWIFDEDEEKRAPMFEYFKALKLVKCMASGSTEDITEEIMFTETSSPREWRLAGDNYMKQRLYTIAAKCYRKASQPEKEKLANAYQTALEASRKKTSPREIRDLYLLAGTQFLKCDDLHKAALCFQNSQDYQLAALAFKKNGQLEEAAVQYRRCQNPVEESHCLEELGLFGRAIRVLVDQKMFDRAIDCLHRYDMLVNKLKQEKRALPAVLIENKPSSSEENLCYSAATHYFERSEKGKCLAAINRVQDKGSQIRFLQEKGFWVEAAEKMMEDGQTEQAATLMLRSGETDKALEYARSGLHKQQTAFIHLVLAHKHETKDNFDLEKIKYHGSKALESYIEQSDFGGRAKAKLILGKHTMDVKLLKEAFNDFNKEKPPNEAGKLECFGAFMETKQEPLTLEECQRAVNNIRQAFSMVQVLRDTKRDKNEQQLLYLSFYGVELDVDKQQVTWYPHEYPLCHCLMTSFGLLKGEVSDKVTMDKAEVVCALDKQLLSWISSWSLKVKQSLDVLVPPHLLCSNYLEGLPCDLATCKNKHGRYSAEETDALNMLNTAALFDHHLQTGLENLTEENNLKSDLDSLTNVSVKWKSAKDLLRFLVPLYPSQNRTAFDKVKPLVAKARISKDSVAQVERYLTYLWQNPGRVGKGKSKNVIKERCKSCDWIVQACFFSALLNFEHLNVADEVQSLEKHLMTNVKPWFHKGQKYALFKPSRSRTDNKVMVETIGTRFIESMEFLKNEQDPKEAVFSFTKMISILGTRNKLPLMPAMEHLVFWMEFHFCLLWFFIAQVAVGSHTNPLKPPFYVTSTMFANVNLVNTLMGDSTIQELVILYERHEIKPMFKRQDHLCNFLVGNNKFSAFSLINYFNDLCASSPAQHALAERVLLLTVITLLNIPEGFVSSDYEVPIRIELFKLHVTESMPSSLQLFLNEIKKAATYKDVAVAAMTYLRTRGHVNVFQCQWLGRSTCQMNWKEFQVADYSKQSFSNINLQDLVKSSLQQVQVPIHGDEPDVMDEEDLRKMEAKKLAIEEEEKRKTSIKKIIRLLKVNVMLKRLERKSYKNFEWEELFRNYTISSQSCGICGTTFEPTDGDVDPSSEDISDVPVLQTRDAHNKTEAHQKAYKDFVAFKQVYGSQIHSALDVVKRFLIGNQVEENSTIYTEVRFDVSKLLNAFTDFNSLFNTVLIQRKWSEQQAVLDAFRNLQDEFSRKKDNIASQFHRFQKGEGNPNTRERTDRDQEVTEGVLDIEPTAAQDHGKPVQENFRTQRRSRQNRRPDYRREGRQHYEDYPPEGNYHYDQAPRRFRQAYHGQERQGYYYGQERQDYEGRPDYFRLENRGNRRGGQRYFTKNRDSYMKDLPPRFKDQFNH
ncbi:unnamed protein product [Lymnaea stagnalis]|uniref:UvrD-like helicase ATP-binding domain-containing protein n=1 Tax=Lymnaea stagnalis TaxID=6523 RepID=A0AAV2I083_LYMST